MADEVASLGFAVDSSQLDTAKQKLADVASQSDKTGKSVDDLNASLSKTADSASKSGTGLGQVTPALSAIDSAARRAGVSVADMQARTAAFNAETAKLAAGGSAAGTAIGAIANAAGPAGSALTALGAASKAVTAEHAAHNAIAATLRETLHGLTPVVTQLGGSIGGLREYAAAARLGIEGLALAAGGAALIELAKLGDEVDRSKARFAGLTGSVESGTAAYDAVKAAAHASGVEFSTLASAVEKASIGQATFADKNVTYANTAANAAKATSSLAAAFGTVGSILQTNLANADEENKALNALGDSFQKTGTLSVAAFQAIQAQSPGTALAISRAFGYDKVTEFITQLGKTPITIDQFIQRMGLVAPAVAAGFDASKPATFGQAMRDVEAAGKDLLDTLAKLGAGDVLKQFLVDLQHPLDTVANSTDDVDLAFVHMLATIGMLPGQGLAAIASWANGAIAEFGKVASAAVSAAQTAVGALSQVGSAVGGAVSAAGGAGGTEGIQLGPYTPDTITSSSAGSSFSGTSDGGGAVISAVSPQGTDAGAAGFDLGISDLPAFADGGQLTVTGSGGTDSQLVQFNATPGEVVTVSTPIQQAQAATSSGDGSGGIQGLTTIQGQPAGGTISATPDPATQVTVKQLTDAIAQSAIDITKEITTGNDNIVNALNKLIGGVASTTVNPATGLPIASTSTGTGLTALTAPTSAGNLFAALTGATAGGTFTTQADQSAAASAKLEKAYEKANAGGGSAFDPMYAAGMAVPIRGSSGASSSRFAAGAPLNPAIPLNPNYGSVNPNYGFADASPFDYTAGNNDFTGGEFLPGFDVGGANDYSGAFDYGAGNNDFTGGQFPSDTSGLFGSAVSDFGGGGGTDTGSTGFDSGDVQGFATGGSFVIGGDGGIDTTPVGFMGTRGETVTITPNGVALPAGVTSNIPTAASDPSAARQQAVTKNITINVANRVQAADFLRSRAQIARGL